MTLHGLPTRIDEARVVFYLVQKRSWVVFVDQPLGNVDQSLNERIENKAKRSDDCS